MKKKLLLLAAFCVSLIGGNVQAQVLTESFASIPSTWTQSNTCNSTSGNASWKLTSPSGPSWGASGYNDHTGTTGSNAIWVDASSPYSCDVSITTDSIDVSTLTTPSIEFYWFKNNTNSTPITNTLNVEVFDGQVYHPMWSSNSDSAGWRRVQIDISCLTLNNDIALRFTVNKGSTFYSDIVLDDIKVQELPTGFSVCAAPTSLAISNITTTATATIGEGCNSSATTEVIYGVAGFNPYTAGSSVTAAAGSATLTGLMASSTYEAYAVTSCSSSSYSDTLGPIVFVTPCAVVSTPYSENFDATATGSAFNPSLPVCWDFYVNTTSSTYYPYVYNRSNASFANSGSNALYAYRSSSSSTSSSYADTTMVITPEIQGLDSATKQLKFYARDGSNFSTYTGEVIIGLTDANGTPSSLRLIDTVYANTDVMTEYTVYLDGAQTGDARVAFVFLREIGTFDYVYIDDVEITDIPPCPEPIAFSLTSATRTSATLAWSSSSAAFDIEVGPMGFTQGTGSTFTSSTNSVTATGLMQNTYYDAYVRSNCTSTGDGTSSYVGPFTFKTECGWFASPLTETFGYSDGSGNSSNPDMPDCWDLFKQSTQNSTYAYVDFSSWSGNQATDSSYLYIRSYISSFSGGNVGDTMAAILPLMYDLGNADQQVLINGKGISTSAAYGNQIAVGTVDSTGDMATLYIADTITMTSTYDDYTVDLDGAPSSAARVVLISFGYQASGYTYGYNGGYIDEVTVRQAPQCPEVYDVVATATSDSSAVITWGDSSVVDEYLIDWGLAGFTQGTGTYDTIVGTTWSNNMLMSGETYEFYFQSVCSAMGVNSPWYGPVTLDIPCAPTSIPFADGFENRPSQYGGSTNPNLPDCWTYSVNANPGNSYSYATYSTFSSYSGSGYLYNRMTSTPGDTVVVSLPMIENLSTDGAVLKFYARNLSSSYPGDMAVATTGVMGDYSTAEIAENLKVTNTTYSQFSVYLDSNVMSTDAQRPAFLFYSQAGTFNYVYIDSVEVEALPSCIAYNFMANNVTDTSADLAWSYTGNNSFNLEYGPTGFIQGTGTGAQAGTLVSSITAPYTLNGLSPNTTYDYYVENACNPGTWYGPITFTTECTGPLAAGTYTVGATGDFATLDSVASVLNVCGIGGAVTFELQAGSFAISSALGEINGSSATNTITFKGGSGADTVTVGTDAAFLLEGAKYMNFEDLYIYAPSGKAFRLNGTSDIVIDGNTIEAGQTTSSTINAIVASNSATSVFSTTIGEKNITITNNDISGGYYGVRFYGNFSSINENINISNNNIHDVYYYGIYVYYGTDVTISENTLNNFGSNFAYGIYPYQIDGLKATMNDVRDVNYGLWAYYPKSTSASTMSSEISNNMLQANNYGLSVYYGDSVGVYHNTATGAYPIRDYYNEDNVDIRNNIFQGSTYAYYGYRSDAMVDYNLYHATGSGFGYVYDGSSFSYPDSLGALQALDTLNNMNSVEGDPIFAGPSDLHVFGPLANDAGDNSVGITMDIDGDMRPMSGSTTVDIGADEYDVINDDAALTMLVSPTSGVCGDDSLMVSVEIGNFGQATLTTLTVSADVLGQTLSVTPTGLSIPFGGKDTIMLGYVSNYVGGPMSVVAYTQLTNDGRPNNDTLSTSVDVSDAQQVQPIAPDFACAGETISLSVGHPTTGAMLWTNSMGDTLGLIDADSTISMVLTQDTTLTLSAESTSSAIANSNGVGTGGGNYNFFGTAGLRFSATQQFTLDSVTLYPNGAGTTVINITDQNSGALVWTGSVSTTATGNTAEQVYLGAPIAPGSYSIIAASSTTGGLYREFGVTGYPFTNPTGEVSIDQGSLTNYHYFFYDWKVTVGGCPREDSTITIQVHPDPVAMISVDTANATISATDWTASWSTSGTMNADSVSVEFSNGTMSTDTAGTVTFTANNAGETVTVIAYGPCSSDTLTFTFDVNQISVDEDFMNGTLSIYPNPTRGLFNVEFATEQAKDVEISIVNMVGQVISTDVVEVNGVYNNQFDLSNEAAGVYFITFTTDEGTLTERITVE